MNDILMQILVGVCVSAIIALGTWAIKVHSELIEIKTWRNLFEEQTRSHYNQIYELLSEVREDMKRFAERNYRQLKQ